MSAGIRKKIYNIYNKLPVSARNILSKTIKSVPPRYIFGKEFIETLRTTKKTEFWSKDKISKLREDKLKWLLLHSYHTTKYYRQKFQEKGIKDTDIIRCPGKILSNMGFINKQVLYENPKEFISKHKNRITHDYISTGGTSGVPFYFYIDSSRSSKEWAYIVDQWSRIGFSLASKRATFRGSKILNDWEDDLVTKERKFSSFKLTDNYLDRIWPALNDYEPAFIYAYPSTAIAICKYIEKKQMEFPKTVRGILLGSENIYEGQREYIENVSQKKVFMWYGHSEKAVLAGECEYSSLYHAYPQYGYVEFINQEGKPANPGEFAEIVGTGFLNTVMPFIRYRTGDYCTYLGNSCPDCGRNYEIFTNVQGRWTQEVLYGREGNSICMSAINVHSTSQRNIQRYQFYQDKYGEATVKLVKKNGFSNSDLKAIEREFNEKLDGSVQVKAVVVDNISLTKIGKYKYIDQKIKTAD